MNYQFFDWECFNYNIWTLPGVGPLRGPDPRPLTDGHYVSVLGTAHTFGRFCRVPFPVSLAEATGIPHLDLSTSAVGPSYFQAKQRILELVNAGAGCIIQVPSARSCGNSRYNNDRWHNNVFQLTADGPDGPLIHETAIYPGMFKRGDIGEAIGLLSESKAKWVQEMLDLMHAITVPKILLWFSTRTPEYDADLSSYEKYCGAFPQLVDRSMLDAVAPFADRVVEVTSRQGLPIRFRNRFNGEEGRCYFGSSYRASHDYYPSDEMQREVTDRLRPVVAELLGDSGQPLVPGPHQAMISAAGQLKSIPPYDIYARIKLLQAVRSYQWERRIEGDVGLYGSVDRDLADLLLASLSKSPEVLVDCEPEPHRRKLRLVVCGKENPPGDAETDTLALRIDRVADDGTIVLLVGTVASEGCRRADAVDLVERGFVPEAMMDNDLVMVRKKRKGDLRNWLTTLFRERLDPQFARREIGYLGQTIPIFETRRQSDYGIDHQALLKP